jgi:hypothetical protein
MRCVARVSAEPDNTKVVEAAKRDFKMRSVLSRYFIVDLPSRVAIRSTSEFHPSRKELRNHA